MPRQTGLCCSRSGNVSSEHPRQFDFGPWTATVPTTWLVPAENLPLHEIRIESAWSIVETCTYNLSDLRRYVERRQRTITVQVSERVTRKVLAEKIFEGSLSSL